MHKEVSPRAPPTKKGSRGSAPAKIMWRDPTMLSRGRAEFGLYLLGPGSAPRAPVLLGSGCLGGLFTGKVVLQGGEEVSDDRHTPGPPKQLLAGTTAHVGHIRVVYRKAEDPGEGEAPE